MTPPRQSPQKLAAKRSPCPLSAGLDVVGDRWTLVIVRDLMAGKRRFQEFQKSPEGIPSNILAARLKQLAADGLITRRPYQDRPRRFEYVLTRRGAELAPVLQAIVAWSAAHVGDVWTPPGWFHEKTPEDFVADVEKAADD